MWNKIQTDYMKRQFNYMTLDIDKIMNLKVGGKKQIGRITGIRTDEVPDKEGNILPKLILIVDTTTNTFKIDEAWVYNKDNLLKPQGLWLKLDAKGAINAISTLAKVVKFVGSDAISDLIDNEVELYPKPNGFLALVACENEKFEE